MTQHEAKEHPVRAFLRRVSYRTLCWMRDRAIALLGIVYRLTRVLHRAAARLEDRDGLVIFGGDSAQWDGVAHMTVTVKPPSAEQLASWKEWLRLDPLPGFYVDDRKE